MVVLVSTHSRPKAAGREQQASITGFLDVSTHSRPKAAGAIKADNQTDLTFQHTAARRRLEPFPYILKLELLVSTHSRLKAAGKLEKVNEKLDRFQHTAA